jgi:hypothetical protein
LARRIGEAFIRVRPDTARFGKDAQPGAKRAGQQAGKSFGSGFSGIVKGVLGAAVVTAAFRKVTGSIVDFAQAAAEGARVDRLTNQVLKTTGGAANVTAKEITSLAHAISRKSGIDDAAIQSGSNMLLTFTRIRNEVGKGNDIFDQATQTVTDMSAALGTDMKKQAIQVGKALNDPIKGVSALQRVGVSFTASQKEQIKALVESGDVMGAQKIVLKELATEFGGAAAAAATPWQRFKTLISHALEPLEPVILATMDKVSKALQDKIIPAINDKIIPALRRFGAFFSAEIMPRVRQVADTWLPRLGAAFRNVAGFLTGTVVPALSTLAGFISRNRDFFVPFVTILGAALVAFKAFMFIRTVIAAVWAFNAALIANPIGLVIVAIAALAAGLIYAYKHSETFRKVVDTAFRVIVAVARWWFENVVKRYIAGVVIAFKFVIEWAKKLWRGVQLYFGFWRGLLSAVVGWVVGVKNRIVANFTAVVNFVKGLPARVRSAASGLFDGIRSAFRSALNWIIDKWNSLGFTLPVIEFLGKTIGGQTFRVPQIPRFHSGGIVPGIGDQLIVARPGEGVFTRDQMAALAPAGTAGVTVENMTIQAWSDRFSLRQVRDELALHGVV